MYIETITFICTYMYFHIPFSFNTIVSFVRIQCVKHIAYNDSSALSVYLETGSTITKCQKLQVKCLITLPMNTCVILLCFGFKIYEKRKNCENVMCIYFIFRLLNLFGYFAEKLDFISLRHSRDPKSSIF